MHTTTGPATLNAIWTAIEYQCQPGQYLSASDADYHQCPANSYCNGNGTYTYTDGVDGCLTACPNNYPNSAAGANSQSWCYTNSTTSCATRNPYLGEHGTPTYANVTANCRIYDPTDESDNDNDCKLNSISDCSITSVQCDAGYTSTGSFGPLYGYIGDAALQKAIRNKSFVGIGSHGDQTGLSSGDWEATYNDGTKIKGTSSCNASGAVVEVIHKYGKYLVEGQITYNDFVSYLQNAGATEEQIAFYGNIMSRYLSGELSLNKASESVYSEFFVAPSNANYTASVTGNYCWCKMTGYTLSGAQSETTVSNSRWVFREFDEDDRCAERCAYACAKDMGWTNMFDQFWRQALFGSLASYPTCEPNTINLNWNPNNGDANSQSQCIYDGGITLPDEPSKSGYTFGGWAVQTQSQQNQGD